MESHSYFRLASISSEIRWRMKEKQSSTVKFCKLCLSISMIGPLMETMISWLCLNFQKKDKNKNKKNKIK